MRFSNIGNAAVRFGTVLETRKSNGAVRFFVNPTVRFGAVFLFRKTYGAVRFSRRQTSYGAVWCG